MQFAIQEYRRVSDLQMVKWHRRGQLHLYSISQYIHSFHTQEYPMPHFVHAPVEQGYFESKML